MEDHAYLWTISGRCGRIGCGKPESSHPKVASVRTEGVCSIDHSSITSRRLIGDEGEEWSRCPGCGQMVEPKLPAGDSATDRRRLSSTGRGRLPFTQRHLDELDRIHAGWVAGYFLS